MSDLPGADQVTNANNRGQSAINNFDPTSVANTQRGQFTDLFNTQVGAGPRNANDYFSAYTNQIARNPSVTNLYSQANDIFGVPQLASRANQLNTAVTNEAPHAYNLMRGFDASDAQVQDKVNTDLRFLQPQATAATNQSQTAQNLANQYVQAGVTQNQMNLMPIQSYGGFLSEALARQSTGFTQAAQDQFNALTAKMNAGVQLSTQEMQSLAQLQAAREQYEGQVAQANATQNAANIRNQYQIIPAGQHLVNTVTGAARYFGRG